MLVGKIARLSFLFWLTLPMISALDEMSTTSIRFNKIRKLTETKDKNKDKM